MKLKTTFEIQEKKENKWLVLSIFDQEDIAENDADLLERKTKNPIRIVRDTFNDHTFQSEQEIIYSSLIRKEIEGKPTKINKFRHKILRWKGYVIDLEMIGYSAVTFLILSVATLLLTILYNTLDY